MCNLAKVINGYYFQLIYMFNRDLFSRAKQGKIEREKGAPLNKRWEQEAQKIGYIS
jgi:hypothetical protein